jgi:mono/diheme cytochrome c family protein
MIPPSMSWKVMPGMGRVWLSLSLLAGLSAVHAVPAGEDDLGGAARVVWTAHVEQIFADHCTKCHAGVKQKGGVDLRTPQTVLKGGDDGPIVVPGNAAASKLFKALRVDSDPHMPPEGSKQLTEEEVAIIQRWIEKLPSTNQPAGPIDWRSSAYAASEPVKIPAWAAKLDVSKAVDRFVEEGWKKRKVRGAALASDQTFVRRVYLDLLGRIPTETEVAKFEAAPKKTRREALVDETLGSKEFAVYMSEIFDVVFLDRTAPSGVKKDGTPRASRALRRRDEKWGEFLETAFAKNRPWNEVVRAIILARPEKPDDQGAEYYLYARKENFQGMAEAIAPIAFGVNVKCAQCHNHPLAPEVEQRHYWGLVAAFNRSKNFDGGSRGVSESAIGGFVNFSDLRKRTLPAALFFPNGKFVEEKRPGENEKEEDSPDKYLVVSEKEKKPSVPKFSRREQLAKAATENNPALAKAFVNRAWAMFMGRGLVHPVDALDSRHPASHPELLEFLANDFASHSYDMRRLFRELLLTRAYQLDSKCGTATAPPESFARALDKPLPAEALHRSLIVGITGKSDVKEGALAELRDVFVERFPDLFPAEYNASLQQAAFLSNNPKLDDFLKPAGDNTTAAALAEKTPDAQTKFLFKRLFNRAPDKDELAQSVAFLKDRPAEKAVPELLWTLIASAEFQFNH